MPVTNFEYGSVPAPEEYGTGFRLNTLKKTDYDRFRPDLLGLGDISRKGEYVQTLTAFLDLQGFTDFCNQPDSDLVIPEFMTRYIDWVFRSIASRFKEGEDENIVRIWGSLPFYVKFLGDGLLFMWDTKYTKGANAIENIVVHLWDLTVHYKSEFFPEISRHVSKPPTRLRCGIARGQVISVGEGQDYVGSCINIASRLQKLSLLSFAISKRGIDLHREPCAERLKEVILKKTALRSIGDQELVYMLREEYESLPEVERALFTDP